MPSGGLTPWQYLMGTKTMRKQGIEEIAKLLDAAGRLVRQALSEDTDGSRAAKTTLVDAQYHIGEAMDSVNEVMDAEEVAHFD